MVHLLQELSFAVLSFAFTGMYFVTLLVLDLLQQKLIKPSEEDVQSRSSKLSKMNAALMGASGEMSEVTPQQSSRSQFSCDAVAGGVPRPADQRTESNLG